MRTYLLTGLCVMADFKLWLVKERLGSQLAPTYNLADSTGDVK